MTTPKPFQQSTVDAVLQAFRGGRRYRRFLVADEVGLGKTVVAQNVIREMMNGRSEPLVVFYLCSNLSIATQNRRKLLEVVPDVERMSATCRVDRLTLLPGSADRPTHPKLRLFSLTPDTSIPMRKGRRRDGRQEERALLHALIEKTWPSLFEEWGRQVFRRNAKAYWAWYVKEQREKAGSVALQQAFRVSIRQEFGLTDGQHLLPALRDLDELQLIAHLRNALAASAIEELQPDLVIFDEFQRFRDLLALNPDRSAERVIGRLRGEQAEKPPALLLLSATPYRIYARRTEEATGASSRDEFFELVEFLYGGTNQARVKREECEKAFAVLDAELRKGELDSIVARAAKRQAEELLRVVMARTERASHPAGWQQHPTEMLAAEVSAEDLRIFKHASQSFQEQHRTSAVAYWVSIPLAMQSMGAHYVAWKAASDTETAGTPRLDEAMRDRFERPDPWPHPRLRALRELLPPKQLVPPWIAPSCPWWDLRGPWRDHAKAPVKALLFSRFRAVPQTVAAALSFDLEAHFLAGEKVAYADVTGRRLLRATKGRNALLALFHPSPFLVGTTEPLAGGASIVLARQTVRIQLRTALQELGVRVDAKAPNLLLWQLIARLEMLAGHWGYVLKSWEALDSRISRDENPDSGLAQLLSEWDSEARKSLIAIRPRTLDALAQYALAAPGVVMGRALRRHWAKAVNEDGFQHTLDSAWTGLRTYLDQRCFFAAFRRGKQRYPEVIQRLVLEGNLESVLDEHVWITSTLRSLEGSKLADELRDGLSVKSGLFYMHPIGNKDGNTFSLRCHVAMPFVEARAAYAHESASRDAAEAGAPRIRTDEMRKAFNTPFWPYVLATTSVGQEGLDFHAWCDTIIHWDLCRNPVDLEQREGRIQRFGGLAIRRAVVNQLREEIVAVRKPGESPWIAIHRLAEERLSDTSGLAPWWVCEGGGVRRYVFDIPTSEQRHWLRWVQEQRLLYRLALGQPNQEDLLELMAARGGMDAYAVGKAAITLSPWFGGHSRNDGLKKK